MTVDISDNHGHGSAGWSLPPVHPEGRKFGLIAAALALAAVIIGWGWLAWTFAILTVCILAFFRDPRRVTPLGDDLVVAPADGLVTLISKVMPPRELCIEDAGGPPLPADTPVTRVSIFMSVFDVHINRAPIAGTVQRLVYIPGRFVNAELDKASEENERQHILIDRGNGLRIGVTQIAGLVARRIVPFVKPGDTIACGQRFGLIRFGSRVDVYLPEGTDPLVLLGQRVIAGETILARIGRAQTLEGVGQ
ncbi:MAG: phosphatidylserine decarboxylase [Sphingomonadales bacterium]|nr:phosphatidylserine decarboxylase [Sphingomonadales bacterium]